MKKYLSLLFVLVLTLSCTVYASEDEFAVEEYSADGEVIEEETSEDYMIEDGFFQINNNEILEPSTGLYIHKDYVRETRSQAQIFNALMGLMSKYPEGMYWGYDSTYDRTPSDVTNSPYAITLHRDNIPLGIAFNSVLTACNGYAWKVSDELFGINAPIFEYRANNSYNIKVGDLVSHDNHIYIVLSANNDWIYLTEGNASEAIRWSRLEENRTKSDNWVIYSRYVPVSSSSYYYSGGTAYDSCLLFNSLKNIYASFNGSGETFKVKDGGIIYLNEGSYPFLAYGGELSIKTFGRIF